MAACRSCLAPIIWGVTEKGHRMPLDAKPNPDGNIELNGDTTVYLTKAEIEAVRELPMDTPRYTSHFATCPNAAKHRKRDK